MEIELTGRQATTLKRKLQNFSVMKNQAPLASLAEDNKSYLTKNSFNPA